MSSYQLSSGEVLVLIADGNTLRVARGRKEGPDRAMSGEPMPDGEHRWHLVGQRYPDDSGYGTTTPAWTNEAASPGRGFLAMQTVGLEFSIEEEGELLVVCADADVQSYGGGKS